ncbi:DNA mismatch repair protein Msh3-like [Liolophura sinensis]|uniref:DNA mismatch repair protein Msh3-like n=1 Tax=Liolophura sinensis TaxID=3198878 RepID=UPI0031591DB8
MCVFENLPTTSLCSPSKPQTIAIMSVQPSTGELVYDCFEDGVTRSQLETRILHLEPVELLLPQTLTERTESLITDIVSLSNTDDDRIRMERLEDSVFEHGKAFETIMDFYSENEKGSEVLQDVITLPRQTLSCLAALITYLREFNLHRVLRSLSSITRFTTKHKYMDLGGNTVKNLELFSNLTDGGEKGSLFWIMNHTVTKFGSRLLRTWVRQPLLDTSEIKARQDAVEELLHGSCPELCQLQAILKQLPDLEKGLCTIFHKKCSPAEFCLVVRALHRVHRAVTQLLDTAGAELRSKLLKQSLGQIPDLLSDVSSYSEAISDQAARENDKTKLFIDEIQFPAIVERKLEIEKVLSELKGHRREVRLTLKQPTLEFVTIMGTEFLVEVRNAHLKLVPSDWLKINSTKAMSRFHTPFIEKKYKELNQLREKLLIDCTQTWMTFLDSFGENYQRYKRAIHHVAVLDCLFSLVNVANHGNCCRPDIVEDSVEIRIDQGRHPVVDQLLGGQDQYVPNDTALKGDAQRVMIITGPNMGGKSSYIRQVALIVIMAQIGSYVPAEFARLGVFDAVFTRMGARDDLYRGRSTFMVELQEASAIMAQATHKSLVILDELGRGTSTHDGVAIAHATLAHFITQVKCLTLFVTHYPSLAEFEKIYPEHVNNFHMSFMLLDEIGDESDYAADNAITFLYQVVRGKAARSYGLNVARLADIPHDILKLAACKSQELEEIIAGKREALDVFCRIFSSRTLRTESSSPSADSMNLG